MGGGRFAAAMMRHRLRKLKYMRNHKWVYRVYAHGKLKFAKQAQEAAALSDKRALIVTYLR